jgi:hypothetical protein
MLKRSARFAATADGSVVIRRRPVVSLCHAIGEAIEYVDALLDAIPAYSQEGERRRWYWHGHWVCRLRLHRIWLPLQDAGLR